MRVDPGLVDAVRVVSVASPGSWRVEAIGVIGKASVSVIAALDDMLGDTG